MSAAALRCALLALTLVWPLWPAAQTPPPDPIARQAEQALWWGDIDTLVRLYDNARRSTAVNAYNGRSEVQSVRSGMAEVFSYGQLNDAYHRELVLLTHQWAAERPQQVLPQLLHARALYAHAWHVRGNGYWPTVPAPARSEFARLIAQAEKHISDRAALLMPDTSTHLYLMMIGRSASWPLAQIAAMADDALARGGPDAFGVHEEVAIALLPKWMGSWELLTAYLEEVDRTTQAAHGHSFYARLWAMAASNIDGNLFKLTQADWPRIRKGYEQLVAAHADPRFINRLAYLACLAEDRDTLSRALQRVGAEPDLQHWAGGGAGGRQNHEACVRWDAAG
jgi:hypothetical protein